MSATTAMPPLTEAMTAKDLIAHERALKALRMISHCCGHSSNWNGETHAALVEVEAALAAAEGRAP